MHRLHSQRQLIRLNTHRGSLNGQYQRATDDVINAGHVAEESTPFHLHPHRHPEICCKCASHCESPSLSPTFHHRRPARMPSEQTCCPARCLTGWARPAPTTAPPRRCDRSSHPAPPAPPLPGFSRPCLTAAARPHTHTHKNTRAHVRRAARARVRFACARASAQYVRCARAAADSAPPPSPRRSTPAAPRPPPVRPRVREGALRAEGRRVQAW